MKNKKSCCGLNERKTISFKIMVIILIASFLFVSIVGMMTHSLFNSNYKKLEQEKLDLIVKSIVPTMSVNLSLLDTKAIEKEVLEVLKNPNILAVEIIDVIHGEKTYFGSTITSMPYFTKIEDIYGSITHEKLAEIHFYYSQEHFKMLMNQFYESFALIFVLYLMAMFVFMKFIMRSLEPIQILAIEMEKFDPNKPTLLSEVDDSSSDEIAMISRANNKMILSIQNYSANLIQTKNSLERQEAHLKNAQYMANIGSWEYFLGDEHMLLSSEMYRLLGHHKSQKMSWDKFLKYIVKEDRNYFEQVITNALKKGATFSIEYQLKRGDSRIVNIKTNGKVRKKSSGEVRIMAVSMDITEQNESQKTIERLAYYDALTNLPNRTLFKDRLQESIALARREAHSVAILFIDLDRFKLINDSLGHSVGDQLLAEVALRLNSQLREVDTLARVGGDEFIIILPHIKGAEDAMLVAKKLLDVMQKKWELGNSSFYTTSSIGVSLYPMHSEDMDILIKYADTAMYKAKDLGRNSAKVYDSSMSDDVNRDLELEQDLREAVKNTDQLELYYQAKVDFITEEIVGAEVLIRWNHPTKGILYPDSFIELAESTGMILDIGQFVIQKSVETLALWNKKYLNPVNLALNLSARQFQHNGLIKNVQNALETYDVSPELLELEITESISMENITQTLRILKELKSLGIALSIDDFGTGYSSLAYLKQFPVDYLKIDREFVKDMAVDHDDATIVQTIISMAMALGLKTIAEGVEDTEHVAMLRKMGCDYAQGYYYSKPIPLSEFEKLAFKKEKKA